MFKDKELAIRAQQTVLNSLRTFQYAQYAVRMSDCSEEEFEEFTKSAQEIISDAQSKLLDKIVAMHPELAQPQMILETDARRPRAKALPDADFKDSVAEPPLTDRNLLLREQEILLAVNSLLDYAVLVAAESGCPEHEWKRFAKMIGGLMGEVINEALEPIWGHNRDLCEMTYGTYEES